MLVVLEPLENIAKSRGKVNKDQLGKKKKKKIGAAAGRNKFLLLIKNLSKFKVSSCGP